jgi:hypothetical protein
MGHGGAVHQGGQVMQGGVQEKPVQDRNGEDVGRRLPFREIGYRADDAL